MTNPLKKLATSTNIYQVMTDLRICFSCRLKSHLVRNLMLKFTFKNYEIKLNYQILKVGIPLEILSGLPCYLAHLHTIIFCISIYNIFG